VKVSTHSLCVRMLNFTQLRHLEELKEVIELSVDVPAHRHRRLYWLHVALFHEQVLHLHAPYMSITN